MQIRLNPFRHFRPFSPDQSDPNSCANVAAASRRYSEALAQARTQRCRRELWDDLFHVLATDLVPDRPGHREPRAVKRRPKPYPRLRNHRRKFMEIPHQNRYRFDNATK
jgi:hypothetical protein